MNNWTYNEFKHCGVDYSDIKQAEIYDEQHQKFRDYEKEVIDLLHDLSLDNPKDLTLIDLACGTGATTIHAARFFKKIFAVDVSEVMIKQAKRKAEKGNISNIDFIQSGFLTYEHKAEPVDIVLTKAALHHLPDFWKQIALLRINKMLKMGGVFYLFDVVFHFPPQEYIEKINHFISVFEKSAGEKFKEEVETHIRDEYSTFSWIMEGMMERAGFEIEKSRTSDGFVTEYFCKKVKEITLPNMAEAEK